MDARFHDAFVRDAKRAKKLPADYRVPETARENLPRVLEQRFAGWRKQGLFAELPFGSDFTAEELVLAQALRRLQTQTHSWRERLALASRALSAQPSKRMQPYLERMALARPGTWKERIEQRVLLSSLEAVLGAGEERLKR